MHDTKEIKYTKEDKGMQDLDFDEKNEQKGVFQSPGSPTSTFIKSYFNDKTSNLSSPQSETPFSPSNDTFSYKDDREIDFSLLNSYAFNSNVSLSTGSSLPISQKVKILKRELFELKIHYKETIYSLKKFISDNILLEIFNYFIEHVNQKLRRQKSIHKKKIDDLKAIITEYEVFDGKKKVENLQDIVNKKDSIISSHQNTINELKLTIEELTLEVGVQEKRNEKHLNKISTLEEQLQTEKEISNQHVNTIKLLQDNLNEILNIQSGIDYTEKKLFYTVNEVEEQKESFMREFQLLKDRHETDIRLIIDEKDLKYQDLKDKMDKTLLEKDEALQALKISNLNFEEKINLLLSEKSSLQQDYKDLEVEKNEESENLLSKIQDLIKELDILKEENQKMKEENKLLTSGKLDTKKSNKTEVYQNDSDSIQNENIETLKSEFIKEKRFANVIEDYERVIKSQHIQRNKILLKCNELERVRDELLAKISFLDREIDNVNTILQVNGISKDVDVSSSKIDTVSILNRLIHKLNLEIESISKQKNKLLQTFRKQEIEMIKNHDKDIFLLRKQIQRLEKESSNKIGDTTIERTLLATFEERCIALTEKVKSLESDLIQQKNNEKETIKNATQRIILKYKSKLESLQKKLNNANNTKNLNNTNDYEQHNKELFIE